jgi:hypothetical protein
MHIHTHIYIYIHTHQYTHVHTYLEVRVLLVVLHAADLVGKLLDRSQRLALADDVQCSVV